MDRETTGSAAGTFGGRDSVLRPITRLVERIRGGLLAKAPVETAQCEHRPTQGLWFEQGELWRQRARSSAAATASGEQPVLPTFAHSEIVRRPPLPLASRTQSGTTAYAERRRAPHTAHIARFMTVNRTIEGGRAGDYRLVQTSRAINAEYDLWKGPASRVTFLLG